MDNLIPRTLYSLLKTSLTEPHISVLLGPRQTGKTTIINLLISELKAEGVKQRDIVSITFDDPEWRTAVAKHGDRLRRHLEQSYGETLENLTGKKYLFLDEVQKAPALFDIIKMLFDRYKSNLTICLTGSSSLQLYQQTAETLSGRIRTYYMSALTWAEIIAAKGIAAPAIISRLQNVDASFDDLLHAQADIFRQRAALENIWDGYLRAGGLPEIFLLSDEQAQSSALKNYLATYIETDIRTLPRVGDPDLFLETLNTLLLSDGSLINVAGLSQVTGIPRLTINKYMRILEETLVSTVLTPLVRPNKQTVKSPKIYFFDHGLINYRRQLYSLEQIKASEQWGTIVENIIINNARAHFVNNPEPPALHFWRDYQNHEIDLVIKTADTIVPVEITVANTLSRSKRLNFRAFFEACPEAKRGYMVWGGDLAQFEINGHSIIALPYWLWL